MPVAAAAPIVGLSGAAMALIGIPVLGLGAYLIYRAVNGDPDSTELREAEEKFTRRGPRGELVFNEDAARSILRQLPGMVYSHPQPHMLDLIELHADRTGMPPARDLSAAHWVQTQNRRMSILAPVYLPMPTGAQKFLRLAQPGHEADFAPMGYAVLLYAHAIHRPVPGQPTHGLPPRQPQRSAPVPTPVSQAYMELPPALHTSLTQILRRPIRPQEGQELAAGFSRAGLNATAELVATKAANVQQQQQLGMPPIPPNVQQQLGMPPVPPPVVPPPSVVPQGWIAPVAIVQALLNKIGVGEPLVVDGNLGPKTRAAVQAFQSAHGLPATGDVDSATLVTLNSVVEPASTSPVSDTWAQARRTLSWPGFALSSNPFAAHTSSGASIPALATPSPGAQALLVQLHYSPTFAGVQAFQTAVGLPASGIVNTATIAALVQVSAQSVSSGAVSSLSPIQTAQMWLVRLNLLPRNVRPNGILDENTRRAIRSFQSARGLPATGLLDARTTTLLAKAATTPTTTGAPLAPYPDVPRQNISTSFLGSPTPWW